ncbi:MAG: glycosyltransferase [Chloroflexi bacterium]|nr:glycosyltransferase [Chloroflexota bacterium]
MATVDLVLPVYNEEAILERSTETVLAWTEAHPEHEWRIVIADNASVDRTRAIAGELQERHEGRVALHHIPVKGRGIALRIAFLTSHADVSAYMDVDLSTDIKHIPELVDPIAAGEVDVAYGTRLHADSETARGWRREAISRAYVQVLRRLGGLRVTDAQCGFKAISRRAARELVPLVEDTQWFWDSELLLIAQENGYRLREVPVRWVEDRDSRVAIVRTAMEDLHGIWRLRRGGVPRVMRQPGAGA